MRSRRCWDVGRDSAINHWPKSVCQKQLPSLGFNDSPRLGKTGTRGTPARNPCSSCRTGADSFADPGPLREPPSVVEHHDFASRRDLALGTPQVATGPLSRRPALSAGNHVIHGWRADGPYGEWSKATGRNAGVMPAANPGPCPCPYPKCCPPQWVVLLPLALTPGQ